MEIKTAEDAAEVYKSFDDWRYADREAAWKWMFEQGRMAEREACAKLCQDVTDSGAFDGRQQYASAFCRDAIRSRSNLKLSGGA